MNDSQALIDLNDSPENSPTPRPWSRLHGTKHRDFSASRLQVREKARQRVLKAIQEERQRAREQAESWRTAGLMRAADSAVDVAQNYTADSASSVISMSSSHESLWLQLEPAPQSALETAPADLRPESPRPDNTPRSGYLWAPAEESARPAWLSSTHSDVPYYAPADGAAETLEGARDRLASRWFALKGMFEGAAFPAEAQSAPAATTVSPAPVLAMFSLAGGVGKSSLAAALARTFSARGERVLLVETTAFGLLPFFFGARDRRPGVLRTFAPPEPGGDAPIQMIALDADSLPNGTGTDPLAAEIARCAQGVNRVIVDIATASTSVARRVLRMFPKVLVPVVPDMNSVVNTGFLDALFQRKGDAQANSTEVCYVLNQFDSSLPLHLDVREVLRERLGDRLLPFVLRHTPAVSEALAEGMTVVDYEPASSIAEDFNSLAAWIKARSAPAGSAGRPVRWIEK
jgi:cellulose synthase operon protein YhjQ